MRHRPGLPERGLWSSVGRLMTLPRRKPLLSLTLPSALAAAIVTLTFTSTASASVAASAFGGYGLPKEASGEDLFRLGLGGRLGYTFPLIPLYFGASSTLHLGSADDEPDAETNALSYHCLEFGADLEILSVGLRPYLMAGVADVVTTRDVDGGFLSPAVGVGVAPYYNIIDSALFDLFVGLDWRFVVLTHELDNGDNSTQITRFPLYLELGARLF
jgi:hypothetical protein